jgi:hypothetical protein
MSASGDWQNSKLVTVLAIAAGIGLAVVGIADLPPISWINEWQGRSLGFYSVKLSMVIALFVFLIPAGIIVAIVKAVREASAAYAPTEEDEDLYRPRRRRRRAEDEAVEDDRGPRERRRRKEGYYDAEEAPAPRRRRHRDDDEDDR